MPASHAALIVDSDPQGLEALVYGFQGAEWRITACQSAETACVLVKASGAELVVVASRTEHDKTRTLLEQLRTKDALRSLPVLVLGPEELRASLKMQGNVDLLPLPLFVRDVITASQLIVATRPVAAAMTHGTTAQAQPEEPAFEAPVTAAATLSMVRTLGGLTRSGLLQLNRKDRHGEILFHEGELTGAQVGQLQNTVALHHLLLWNDGSLKLRLRSVGRRGQMRLKAREFAEDFERFQRDYNHAVKDVGPTSTVYIKQEERLMRSGGEVPAEVTPVVRLCDGLRTLADIIDESPFRVLDTVRIVGRLVDFGILKRREPKPAGDGSAARTELDEFWETARIVGPVGAPVGAKADAEERAQAATTSGEINSPAASVSQRVPSPVPATHAHPTASAQETEQRSQHQDRREGDRRTLSGTLQVGNKPGDPFRSRVATPPANAAPVPVIKVTTPVQPSANSPAVARASGTIELRKGERRSQPTMRGFADRASVVVDIGATDAPRAPVPSSGVIPVVAKPLEVTKTTVPNRAGVPLGSTAPANSGARITGVLEVTPSKKAVRPAAAPARVSIQIDALFDSPAPKPPVPARPPAQTKPVPVEPHPWANEPAQPAPAARPRRGTPIVAPSAQASPVSSAPASAARSRTSSTMSVASGQSKSRPSGNFSAVESDFFEREADLYRVEKAESFADLEDKNPKPGTPAGKNDRGRRK